MSNKREKEMNGNTPSRALEDLEAAGVEATDMPEDPTHWNDTEALESLALWCLRRAEELRESQSAQPEPLTNSIPNQHLGFDADVIRLRIEDCSTYNFGMYNANKLAHEDAPRMLAYIEAVHTVTGEQINRAGWTCDGIHEPGSHSTCDDCREACNDLANFYNQMRRTPEATGPWTYQPEVEK